MSGATLSSRSKQHSGFMRRFGKTSEEARVEAAGWTLALITDGQLRKTMLAWKGRGSGEEHRAAPFRCCLQDLRMLMVDVVRSRVWWKCPQCWLSIAGSWVCLGLPH